MKIVFAGPSICGAAVDLTGIELRAPAVQGNILSAVLKGATAIGLVDGAFEATASVWHKEILFALAEGVAVVGGASMGALRAAECAAFGMEPVGSIAQLYLSGASDDDALVAITHGPAELGSPPLTEALVDCEATIGAMAQAGVLSEAEAARARRMAGDIYYKERTVERLATVLSPGDPTAFETAYSAHRISIKTHDAIAVVDRVRSLPGMRRRRLKHWQLREPPMWRDVLRQAKADGQGDAQLPAA